ncbi:MAG TPA: YebC/PmpR family DNA-binding transcriptional regulator [Verrucomicrobiae bacterium]|nr:YebC/PmpR family DNA-binding transcriptional regulator [Verrucomicrobiae bacterium]
MGAQWKQAGRVANATKRGQVIGKLVREILVAAKLGGPEPDMNARLAAAVEAARKASVPRDTIDRAIKKGSGQTEDKVVYELVTYEGFAPHKVPIIVECLTDNRNRTAPEIRHLFRTGSLGAPGSVGFFFDHLGVVEATHTDKSQDLETAGIEAGAQNVEPLEHEEGAEWAVGGRFFTELKDLDAVSKFLSKAGWKVTAAEMRYQAKNFTELSEAHHAEVVAFLQTLDDHDDVHRVYAALK